MIRVVFIDCTSCVFANGVTYTHNYEHKMFLSKPRANNGS